MNRLRTLLGTGKQPARPPALPRISIGGISSPPPPQTELVIAMLDPGVPSPRWHARVDSPLLRLDFADTWPGRAGHTQYPATAEHLETAWAFIAAHRWGQPDGPHLHLHCQAGHSRSPAVALYLLRRLLGKGSEPAAVSLLWQVRPGAAPNIWVLQLADHALSSRLIQTARRNGNLSGDGWT